jgi:hypothetical protein
MMTSAKADDEVSGGATLESGGAVERAGQSWLVCNKLGGGTRAGVCSVGRGGRPVGRGDPGAGVLLSAAAGDQPAASARKWLH